MRSSLRWLPPLAIAVLTILIALPPRTIAQTWPDPVPTADEVAAGSDIGAVPITLVTNGWVAVREILDTLAEGHGLGLQIAPDVEGDVNVHFRDMPLAEGLDSMLAPLGCVAEIRDGVLSVRRRGLETRWFHFDYPATVREGKGGLQISSAGGGGGGGGGGGSGGGGSASSSNQSESEVLTRSAMNVWPRLTAALQTVIFDDTEAGAEQDAESVAMMDGGGRRLVVDAMAGLIQITAEAERLETAAGLLRRLDESLRRQVAIEVRILEVTLSDGLASGVDWATASGRDARGLLDTSTGAENPIFRFVVDGTGLTGLLEMISEQGEVRVLSRPSITTLNNQKAVVRVVTEEVFFEAQVEPVVVTNGVATEPVVEYLARIIPVGVVLDVTPQIAGDGAVTLNVHPTISNIVRIEESPNEDTQPVISIRELDTVGCVGDGQTLIIAGLLAENERRETSGLPILKDIPLLGKLFSRQSSYTTKTELVMLLTPTILDDSRMEELALEAEMKFGRQP